MSTVSLIALVLLVVWLMSASFVAGLILGAETTTEEEMP